MKSPRFRKTSTSSCSRESSIVSGRLAGPSWVGVGGVSVAVALYFAAATCFLPRTVLAGNEYLLFRPEVLELSEEVPSKEMRVTCRQLPSTQDSAMPASLSIKRRRLASGQGSAELVAGFSSLGAPQKHVVDGNDQVRYEVTGSKDNSLEVKMSQASCREASFSYLCINDVGNGPQTTEGSFTTVAKPPTPVMTASPNKERYAYSDTVTLTCRVKTAVGLNLTNASGSWTWEHTDLLTWRPARKRDITTEPESIEEGCLQFVPSTSLTVYVDEMRSCAQLYRCYVRTLFSQAPDEAAEFLVDRGYDCTESSSFLVPSPATAIVVILALISICTAAAYFAFERSRRVRRLKKLAVVLETPQRDITPMSPEQQTRLVQERLKYDWEATERAAAISTALQEAEREALIKGLQKDAAAPENLTAPDTTSTRSGDSSSKEEDKKDKKRVEKESTTTTTTTTEKKEGNESEEKKESEKETTTTTTTTEKKEGNKSEEKKESEKETTTTTETKEGNKSEEKKESEKETTTTTTTTEKKEGNKSEERKEGTKEETKGGRKEEEEEKKTKPEDLKSSSTSKTLTKFGSMEVADDDLSSVIESDAGSTVA